MKKWDLDELINWSKGVRLVAENPRNSVHTRIEAVKVMGKAMREAREQGVI